MNGRNSEDRTSSPSTLGAKANGDSPPLRPRPVRMASRQGKTKRKVSKGMIKRVEGGGMGLMNNMGWYDASHEAPNHEDAPPTNLSPGRLDLRSNDFAVDSEQNDDEEQPETITESPKAMSAIQ